MQKSAYSSELLFHFLRSVSGEFFFFFLCVYLSDFHLYLTDQGCNKRAAENPPLYQGLFTYFIVLTGAISLCKKSSFLNYI